MKKTLIIIGASLLASCATTNTASRSSGIELGMTQAQVRAMYGQPVRINSSGNKSYWSYDKLNKTGLLGIVTLGVSEMVADGVDKVRYPVKRVTFEDGKVNGWTK